MSGAKVDEKPKNKIVVLIYGPPRSGKTQIAQEVLDLFDNLPDVDTENVSVITTNDIGQFETVLGEARDGGAES